MSTPWKDMKTWNFLGIFLCLKKFSKNFREILLGLGEFKKNVFELCSYTVNSPPIIKPFVSYM